MRSRVTGGCPANLYLPIGLPMRSDGLRRTVENGVDRDGEGRNRTGDTTVFSRVLYRLSYLALRGDSLVPRDCR